MELTNPQIDQRLIELGSEVGQLEKDLTQFGEEYERASFDCDNAIDKAYLSLKAEDIKLTVRELDAMARDKCHAERLSLLEKDAKYKSVKNKIDALKTKIGILQSIIKLRCSEMENIK